MEPTAAPVRLSAARSWEQGIEMRSALEAVESKSFTALSVGLGLGEARAKAAKKPSHTEAQTSLEQAQAWAHIPSVNAESPGAVSPQGWTADVRIQAAELLPASESPALKIVRGRTGLFAPKAPKSQVLATAVAGPRVLPLPPVSTLKSLPLKPAGISKRLFAYSVDFLFVVATLATAFALAALLVAVRTGETENPLALAPVQWLVNTKPVVILTGVYAAFFAYALLFKGVAGRTFGEAMLRVPTRIPRKIARP